MLLARQNESWTAPPSANEGLATPALNHRAAAMGLTITFTIIAWACSLLRLYTRFFILRSSFWDDLFIVLALLANTVGSIIYCMLFDYGQGTRHMDTMSLDEVNAFLRVFYVGSVTYPLSLTFIKLAVLIQYLRIFRPETARRRISKVLIIITAIWGVIYTFPAWIPCTPPSDMWNVAKPNRHCWGFASPDISEALGFYISHSVSTTLLDLIIFLLPMKLFFQWDTHKNTRRALMCLFALGLVVNLCSIGRLIYSLKPTLDSIWDLSWHSPTTTGLAAIEINLASVCAALPIFWPVVKEKWDRIVVTYEVKITSENGKFTPLRSTKSRDQDDDGQKVELAERGQGGQRGFEPTEWDPYVRDTKTALGDVQTTVQSPAERPVKINKDTSFLLGV